MTDGLAALDASACAELVRRGDVSPIELVRAARSRIERLDPQLNALVRTRFDEAESEAATETGASAATGPFAGVPFLLKDIGALVAGERTDFGSGVLRKSDHRWPVTSYTAQAFADAGLVVLGRTATPEFGTTITTEPLAYGPTRNPWDPSRSAGGSSGGAAAAVASGMVPVAHGSDGGGSLRIPASCCGLVGLKPSRGRVSQGPSVGESWAGSVTDGALARTVRDAAAMLDLLRRPMPGDPYIAPPVTRPYAEELGRLTGRLRVGLLLGPGRRGAAPPDPEVLEGVEKAGRLLEDLGHDVTEAAPAAFGDEDYARHFLTVVVADVALTMRQLERALGRRIGDEEIEPRNATYRRAGEALTAPDYLAARAWLGQWSRRMAAWWATPEEGGAGFDLLVSPVLAKVPPTIGWYTAGGPEQEDARIAEVLQYTGQLNATGQPAMSLPLHETEEGVPVGVQFAAAYAREDLLIRLAGQLEQAQPWAGRRPRVWAD